MTLVVGLVGLEGKKARCGVDAMPTRDVALMQTCDWAAHVVARKRKAKRDGFSVLFVPGFAPAGVRGFKRRLCDRSDSGAREHAVGTDAEVPRMR